MHIFITILSGIFLLFPMLMSIYHLFIWNYVSFFPLFLNMESPGIHKYTTFFPIYFSFVPLIYYCINFHLFKKGQTIPTFSILFYWMSLAISLVFIIYQILTFGLKHHHPYYLLVILVCYVVLQLSIFALLKINSRRPSFSKNFLFHWIFYFWLFWFSLPTLGEIGFWFHSTTAYNNVYHAYSGPNLPLIPEHTCHLFRRKAATHSGWNLPFLMFFPE